MLIRQRYKMMGYLKKGFIIIVFAVMTALTFGSMDSYATEVSTEEVTEQTTEVSTEEATEQTTEVSTEEVTEQTTEVSTEKAIQQVTVKETELTVNIGKTVRIKAKTNGDGIIKYVSSDKSIAKVSSEGIVTPKGVGTVFISVYAKKSDSYTKSNIVRVKIKVGLAAPKNISLTNTASGVKIKYSKVKGASGYYIFRSTSKKGKYTKIGTVKSGSIHTFTDSGSAKTLSSGKRYYYMVKAYSGKVKSEESSKKSIKYLSTVTISDISDASGYVELTWSKVKGAAGYSIYRKKADGNYIKIQTVKSSSTSWTDKSISKNTQYTYYVIPFSGKTTGSANNKASILLPSAPVLSTLSASSYNVTVKWNANSVVSGYQLEYATNKDFTMNDEVINVGKTTTSKTITIQKGSKCYARIRSYKIIGGKTYYSAWSSAKSITLRSKVTVFAGDSIMSGLYISRYGSMINVGGTKHIAAYTSLNVQTFQTNSSAFKGKTGVEKVISYNPTRVYIMLGMNDVCWRPYEDYKNTYIKLIKKIQKACPHAEIVILSVSPVTKGELAKVKNFSKIDTCNSYLEEVAEECGCYYYDFGEGFKGSDGCMKSEYSGGDGIHWSGKGYARFAELINAYDKTLD